MDDAALQAVADSAVEQHGVPGVVAAIADPEHASVAVAGLRALEAPVSRWLPELAELRVLRDEAGPLDDSVPADRPLLVEHLLALRGGLGFTGDMTAPLAEALVARLHQGSPSPADWPDPDAWLSRVRRLPLAHHPGEGWTYNTGLDIAGVLLARAAGASLGEVLGDTVLGPLGMTDTGFRLRADQIGRTATAYAARGPRLELIDEPSGAWAGQVPFESGAGGLVSTVDDLVAFGRMLVAGGDGPRGRVLSTASVERLLAPGEPSAPEHPFLEGQSWSLGGSVDVVERHPWELVGRYGWIGGTGTALYVYPAARQVAVWLSQRELAGPDDAERLVPMLTLAAERARR